MLNVFRRNPQATTIEALYGAIVAQARQPVFYLEYQVPDTVNGRLDLLMLHLALVFEALSQRGRDAAAVGQGLFERFCRDMDDHLREQGVSDLKVPKEMRNVGAAFFGRHGAYLSALRSGDVAGLQAALCRNVYEDDAGKPAGRLAAYAVAARSELEAAGALADARLTSDAPLTWPDPAAIGSEN